MPIVSAAEVIVLNYINTVALKQVRGGSEQSERWACLGTFEKTQDLQRRRLAFLHS